jgi:hypothetical protein
MFILACLTNSFSQNNLTIYNLHSIPQSNYTNPANMPDCKFYITFPALSSIYLGLSHSGFAYDDIVRHRTSDDSLYIDIDNAISKLTPKDNYLAFNMSYEYMSMGVKFKSNYITISASEKLSASITYPKDLLTFLWKGNKPFIGTNAVFDGLGINIMHYREISAGYAHTIHDKLNVGAKVKLLFGKLNIYTEKSNIKLYTAADDFALSGTTDILVNTNLIPEGYNAMDYMTNSGNNLGFGFDFGANYKLNDNFDFGASIIDLGYIKWKDNVKNYSVVTNYTFNGIPFNFFKQNSIATSSIADSIGNIYKAVETKNAYKTSLPTKIFVSANYTLAKKNIFGFLMRTEIVNNNIHPAITLSYNRRFNKLFSLSTSYSIVNKSYLNWGLGFSLNLGAFQLYTVSDNILAAIIPQSIKSFNLLFGINLTFGREGKVKEKEVNQSSIK